MSEANENFDIDLLEYLRIIGKRRGMIIAVTLICLASAMIATANMTPVYEASAKLLVTQRQVVLEDQSIGESYQAVLMNERLAKTFSQMITGRVVAQRVIDRLRLPITPTDLTKKVTAEPIRDTQLIKITVSDTNPQRATWIANTLGEVFSKTVKEMESSPSKSLTNVSIVEPAIDPVDPVKPKPALNMIIAVIIGLMVSIGLSFLLERLDVTVKSGEETERLLGVTFLGGIPVTDGKSTAIDNDPHSSVSEAFRSLRTNIQYLNFDQSTKVIVVTSPVAKEGKTTLSANLAMVLAQAGHNVLILDCDLRRPRIHEIFGLSNEIGIASILVGSSDIPRAVQNSPLTGLSVLTSGPIPPNPADLLDSERMRELLKRVREAFDFVIVDSPPALAVTDAAILASQADGVLFSSMFSRTNKHALVTTKTAFSKISARILGFVINGVKASGGYGYNYGYSYGYSHNYYGDTPTGKKKAKGIFNKIAIKTLLLALVAAGFMFLIFVTSLSH